MTNKTYRARQTPTQSVILPYKKTHGKHAAKLYNSTGRKAQEWQVLLLNSIMAYGGRGGLWTHAKFGFSVPRRNGKNEVLTMREMYGLAVLGEHNKSGRYSFTAAPALCNIIKGVSY